MSLRYFNAYGPGDLQEPVTRAVPRWIRAALTGEPIVTYWKAQQYRDYVFVEDIARAHIRVLGWEGARVYNLGTGSGVLMAEVLALIQELTARELTIVDGGERPGDPHRLVADVSLIQQETGWRAQTGLRDGIMRTVHFYQQSRSLWDPGEQRGRGARGKRGQSMVTTYLAQQLVAVMAPSHADFTGVSDAEDDIIVTPKGYSKPYNLWLLSVCRRGSTVYE